MKTDFFLKLGVATLALVVVAWKTGESPRWTWGFLRRKKKETNPERRAQPNRRNLAGLLYSFAVSSEAFVLSSFSTRSMISSIPRSPFTR